MNRPDLLVRWLVGWLVRSFVGSFVRWLVDSLHVVLRRYDVVFQLVGSLVGWLKHVALLL